MYNYREEITEDIKSYLKENYTREEIKELNFDSVYDDLFIEDSVTGNASGSYYCNSYKASQALSNNESLLLDALDEFEGDYRRAIESPEYADITIRCYLLSECLTRALEELSNE